MGDKSIKEVASGADVPYRSMQNMLDGGLPYGSNLAKIAAYFGVPETHLFVDFEEFGPKRKPTPAEALAVISEALAAKPPATLPEAEDFNEREMAMLRAAVDAIKSQRPVSEIRKKRENQG